MPKRLALSRRHIEGLAWAGLTVAIFSGWFVVTRFSVTRDLRIWDITALRFGVGAALLAPAVLRHASRIAPAAWRDGLVFSLLWGVPFVLLVALGLQLTSAAVAASITPTLMPVFAGLFAWAFLRERTGGRRLIGYAAIVSGLVGLVISAASAQGVPSPAGLGALALAAAMWAIYTLLFRRSGLTPIQSAGMICIWSAAIFLPAYFLLGLSRLQFASNGEIAFQALYQGVLVSGIAIVSFNRAVSLLGAVAATAVIALIPAAATILAIPILGEVPTAAEGAAIAVIAIGVVLATRPARQRSDRPAPEG